MAVTVKLPTILRKFAGDEARVTAEGATLGEVLKDLESRYPGVTKNVLAEGGGLHRFINLYVNDEDVRYLGSLETAVADGDVVSILPASRAARSTANLPLDGETALEHHASARPRCRRRTAPPARASTRAGSRSRLRASRTGTSDRLGTRPRRAARGLEASPSPRSPERRADRRT